MIDPISVDLQKTLQELYNSSYTGRRLHAISILDRLSETNAEIVQALVVASATDKAPEVRSAAAIALQAPVHQAFLKENPDFLERSTGSALRIKEQILQEEEERFITEFQRRLSAERRKYIIFLASIFTFFGWFIFMGVRNMGSDNLVTIFQVSVFLMAGFFMWSSWKNWRCPACDSFLAGFKAGINIWFASRPLRCPHCGARLL